MVQTTVWFGKPVTAVRTTAVRTTVMSSMNFKSFKSHMTYAFFQTQAGMKTV